MSAAFHDLIRCISWSATPSCFCDIDEWPEELPALPPASSPKWAMRSAPGAQHGL
jgi:hypothetical protein